MPVWNTLVEGDNLEVLPALPARLAACGEPDLAEVDLVYLDPPYNTGHDFAYADDIRGTDGAGGVDRHRAWVSWLRPRLEAVRALMAPGAAVFVSIDDHEMAHLRLLLDDVFGEAQFLAQVVVNLNPKGRQLGHGFATSHEYLLVYARDAASCVLDARTSETVDERDFPLIDPAGRRYRHLPLRNTNKRFTPVTAGTLHFPLYGDPRAGRVATEPFAGSVEVTPVFGDGRPAVWRWSRPLIDARPDDLVCREVRGRTGPRVDVFQKDWLHRDARGQRRKKLRTIWLAEEVGSTDTAVAELKALVGHVFESPKPTGLLRRVLATMPPDARVLDPFAGSGTTGHAVALANAEDGGTRRCVSVETDGATRPGSHAHRAGLTRLVDVTRVRLRAVDEQVGGGLRELPAEDPADGPDQDPWTS